MAEKAGSNIVCSGGWPNGAPQTLASLNTYGWMAVLWIFPSLGACWIISEGWGHWLDSKSFVAFLKGIRFQEWIAILLLLMHVLWVVLAIVKRPRSPGLHIDPAGSKPHHDLRKLY
jgi:hypothetical protein